MLHALILAGGSGTRFWPLSRRSRPKQCLKLFSGTTLVAETRARLRGLVADDRVWVVAPGRLKPDLEKELPGVAPARFVLEPEGRNTGPAIALALAAVEASDPGATLAVLPADHVIRPAGALRDALGAAALEAERSGRIVLFGIRPGSPATGYGYIRPGPGAGPARPVESFVEKPDLERAKRFVADGGYLWNAGIFVATARRFIEAIEAAAPDLARPLALVRARLKGGSATSDAEIAALYASMPEVPFDRAVVERFADVAVIEAPFQWDDVGDFRAVERHVAADGRGNVSRGSALFVGAARCTVVAPDLPALVVAADVEDILVVATADAILVTRKGDGERLRGIVEAVRRAGRADLLE